MEDTRSIHMLYAVTLLYGSTFCEILHVLSIMACLEVECVVLEIYKIRLFGVSQTLYDHEILIPLNLAVHRVMHTSQSPPRLRDKTKRGHVSVTSWWIWPKSLKVRRWNVLKTRSRPLSRSSKSLVCSRWKVRSAIPLFFTLLLFGSSRHIMRPGRVANCSVRRCEKAGIHKTMVRPALSRPTRHTYSLLPLRN